MKMPKRLFALTGLTVAVADILLMLAGAGIYGYIIAAACLLLVLSAVFFRKHIAVIFPFFLAVLLACASFCFEYYNSLIPQTAYDGTKAVISGIACDYVSCGSVKLKDCEINSVSTDYSITVYFKDGEEISPGDRVTIENTELSARKNDGNVFFYHTLSSGTVLTASAYFSPYSVDKGEKTELIYQIARLRHSVTEKLSAFLSPSGTPLANALVTGNKDGMSDEALSNLRTAGVSHIFAVSGMHLAIWTSVIFFFFGKGSRVKKIPIISAIIFVLFYTAFTGFSASVLRSAVMLLTVLLGNLIKRKADPLNSLGFAVTVILLAKPFLAGNVSFLLSAVATLGIVALYPALFAPEEKEKTHLFPKVKKVGNGILLCFTVIMLTVPLTAVFFGYVSLLTPVSSLLCTPLAEGIMLTAGLGLILPSGLCSVPFSLCEILCRVMTSLIGRLSELKFAVCPLDKKIILPWFALSLIAFIAICARKKDRKERLRILCLACSLFIVLFSLFDGFFTKGDVEIYLPQAGSNTVFAVTQKGENSALVIGAGGDYASSRNLSSYLSGRCVDSNTLCVIPREKQSENSAEKYIQPLCTEVIRNSETRIVSQNNEYSFSGNYGRLNINGTSIFVCFSPSADFDGTDTKADILICRGFIPTGLNPSDYDRIYLMSDKSAEVLCLPENAVSTADGEILITIKAEKTEDDL